jgi:hypothetical protein
MRLHAKVLLGILRASFARAESFITTGRDARLFVPKNVQSDPESSFRKLPEPFFAGKIPQTSIPEHPGLPGKLRHEQLFRKNLSNQFE